MTWNATYTVRMGGSDEMVSSMKFDADDFEDAMGAAVERKRVFRKGADVRISSLQEIDSGSRRIGFQA